VRFVEELSFVPVALFLLLIVIVGIRRVPKSSGGFSVKGTLTLLVLVLLPAVSGWRFVRQVHIVASSDLSAENVESLCIAGQQVTDQTEGASLIQALKEAEWFSNHHGDWAQPVELRVKLRSGEEEHLVLRATYTSPAR
jgi:hypothetical protein